MRWNVILVIVLLLMVTACGKNRIDTVQQQEGVKLYTAMNDDVRVSEKYFDGEEARSIADLVKAECPQGVGDTFARLTFDAKSSTLVVYTDKEGAKVLCSVYKPKDQKAIDLKKASDATDPTTALLVNGKPITYDQIKQQLAALPKESQTDTNTINLLVNRMINDEMLRQQAEKISVTADEIAAQRKIVLTQANLTEDGLTEQLKTQGRTVEDFNAALKEQAQLQSLLDTRLRLKDLTISDEDMKNFYLQNPNQFLQSEQAVARIILSGSSGKTLEQGQNTAREVAAKLNNTDFCALVKQYSDEQTSKDKCGVYVIPKGVIDPNLEVAVFNTPVNQTSVVSTNAGIYFVQTMQVVPAQVVPYPQAAGTLQSNLRNAIFQQRLNLYLTTLRGEATIVSYLG